MSPVVLIRDPLPVSVRSLGRFPSVYLLLVSYFNFSYSVLVPCFRPRKIKSERSLEGPDGVSVKKKSPVLLEVGFFICKTSFYLFPVIYLNWVLNSPSVSFLFFLSQFISMLCNEFYLISKITLGQTLVRSKLLLRIVMCRS